MTVRKLTALLLALLLLLSLTACGASSKAENSAALYSADMAPQEAPMAMPEMEMGSDYAYGETTAASGTLSAESGSVSTPPAQRKWVITMNISAETEDLDALLETLRSEIDSLGGYVEGQNIYNGSAYASRRYRSASLTVRIPAADADKFAGNLTGYANVVRSNKNLEDITLTYVSTESRVTALKTEEARLLELMEQAQSMSDLLEIEGRLTEVRYQLENHTSRLRVYDNQVDYATIYLDINEVKEYTVTEEPDGFGERVGAGLSNSLKNLWNGIVELFILLLINLPYLLLIAAVVIVIIVIIRKQDKKDKKNKNNPKKSDNETPDP